MFYEQPILATVVPISSKLLMNYALSVASFILYDLSKSIILNFQFNDAFYRHYEICI